MLGGPQRPRASEPFGPTIAEVLGLVLGAALVSLAVRQEFAEGWPEYAGDPVSLWRGMLMVLARVPGYLAVCVMPAALVRRQAFGGPMRPAEFAVGVAGMSRLVWALYYPMNLIDRGPETNIAFVREDDPLYARLQVGLLVLGLLAIVVLLIACRRLPGWCTMIAAWLAIPEQWSLLAKLYGPVIDWGFRVIDRWSRDDPWQGAFFTLIDSSAEVLIVGSTLVICLDDAIRRHRAWNWVEWAGVSLLLTQGLASVFRHLEYAIRFRDPREFWFRLAVYAILYSASLALGAALVWWIGPGRGGKVAGRGTRA